MTPGLSCWRDRLWPTVCQSSRRRSDKGHVLFTRAGVLMVCHVGACALFEVITPFQSATVTQLLTSQPRIFHVLPLVSSLRQHRKASAGRKTKSVPWSGHIQASYLPWCRPFLRAAVPGTETKPHLPPAHTGPPVWRGPERPPQLSAAAHGLCWSSLQHPSASWVGKRK